MNRLLRQKALALPPGQQKLLVRRLPWLKNLLENQRDLDNPELSFDERSERLLERALARKPKDWMLKPETTKEQQELSLNEELLRIGENVLKNE